MSEKSKKLSEERENPYKRLVEDGSADVDIEKKTSLTHGDIDYEIKLMSLKLQEEHLKGQRQDREERKAFSGKIFIFLCAFIVITMFILYHSGDEKTYFRLSDQILTVLLTTTTINVIGIFLFVARYLFKAEQSCPHCGMSIRYKQKIDFSSKSSKD